MSSLAALDKSLSPQAACEDGRLAAASPARAWWLLAVLAFGASTVCALLLVVARTPYLGLGAEWFRTALVLHVNLAVVVWFLAGAAGLWLSALAASGGGRLGRMGIWLASGGVLALILSPAVGTPSPVLANYIPVLDSPLFYSGLVAFFAGVGLAGLASLTAGVARVGRAEHWFERGEQWALMASVLAYWGAMLVFVMALSGGQALSLDGRLWGGGHVLQIVYTLLLMAVWLSLGRDVLPRVKVGRGWVAVVVASELLAVAADVLIAWRFPTDSQAYRQGFTDVMRWATWPAPLCVAGWLLLGAWRKARQQALTPTEVGVLASVALFVLGCAVGASIRADNTAVPAHYHGTVGAVTLACMLWGRRWLTEQALVRSTAWVWRAQPLIYAAGVATMVVGLAWAGALGAPRKSPHVDFPLADSVYQLAMGLAGSGGLLATAGAGVFVGVILIALRARRSV